MFGVSVDGKWTLVGAHRIAWTMINGPIPEGRFVCHHCDTPPCANPAHLFLGEPADNTADMIGKGRLRVARRNPQRGDDHWSRRSPEKRSRGQLNGRAKLTADDVAAIRSLRSQDVPARTISERYGVSRQTIYLILSGATWSA